MPIAYAGRTEPGNTDWKQVSNGRGVYVDVDTSDASFDVTKDIPVYITSLGGKNQHWATTGATSIYKATHKRFRVFVRWIDGSAITPEYANEVEWHINWLGRQE
jgi:hypothetical protein